MTPATTTDVLNGVLSLQCGEAVAVEGLCGLVWVEGPDAAGFLQGLLSCDVTSLEAATATDGLLLNSHGHIRAWARLRRDSADAFTLVAEPQQAAVLAETFRTYLHSEDLDVIGPETSPTLTVAGGVPHGFAGPWVPSVVPGLTELVVDDAPTALRGLSLQSVPPESLEVLRVQWGVPRVGVDTGERTLVHEAGLQDRAVSFTKGCYLGQETVARTQHRGRVTRVLRGLALPDLVAPGTEVRLGERVVGHVTSVADSPDFGPIAMAMLRRELQEGSDISVDGLSGPACIRELPFR